MIFVLKTFVTIFLSLSDGLHPSPCSVSLWQHQDGEVPAAATGQCQQQNKGECLPLVLNKTTTKFAKAEWVGYTVSVPSLSHSSGSTITVHS